MNSFATSFSRKLFHSLEERDLYPSHSIYENVYLEIYRVGEKKLEFIKTILTPGLWKTLIEGLGKSNGEGHCMRMLGFGHHLSIFMTAPFTIDPVKREQAANLGMLTNFIVAIYDCFLDLNKKNPLPAWLLYLCSSASGRIVVKTFERFLPSHSRIMVRLVSTYFIQLNLLASNDEGGGVKNLIYRSIKKMYEAEQLIGNDEKKIGTYWLRKSALPFVAMGLPCLLVAVKHQHISAFRFIRNLYRLGEAFGLLDDVTDLIQDELTGQPNIVSKKLNDGREEEEVIDELCQQTIRLLVSVYSEVQKFNLDRTANFYTFYWTPIICVIGWIGGQYHLSAATTSGDGRN